MSQWAEAHRRLSPEGSARAGRYRLASAPYQREPMDAVSNDGVQSVVLMWASQTGKTEMVNNVVAFFISQDPAPMLLLQPTLDMAESWSKDRLAPMLRDTPALKGLVADARSRDSGNTVLHKRFPGGHITVAGANSPASLASRPIRVVLCDEVDRYPLSVGTEGDPVSLAARRSDTFHNAALVLTSTPTIKGASRVEREWEASDQRRWFCACPKCAAWQHLKWACVRWDDGQPETARYVCEACGVELADDERQAMVRAGEWRATAPSKGKAGYHLNGLASLFPARRGYLNRLHQAAAQFLDAKHRGREATQAWVNTFLAETWEEKGDRVETEPLLARGEDYGDTLPAGVLVLTAGVDIQKDRIECEVVGWGAGEESWGVEYRRLMGDPNRPDVWRELDDLLTRRWETASGASLPVACALVDSGDGNTTGAVYDWVRPRQPRRVFASKGSNQSGAPLVRESYRSHNRINLLMVGTDAAKLTIADRLRITEPGPRFMHFPADDGYDADYFKGLTAEEVRTEYRHGFAIRRWVKVRPRNEPLDLRVYALAALAKLKPNMEALAKLAGQAVPAVATALAAPPASSPMVARPPVPRPARRAGGFVNSWKH